MISFVTCIKLMPGYTDFADRLRLYVDSIAEHCTVPYEILIVEDRCARNVALLDTVVPPAWLAQRRARILPYVAAYPNPHGYNMIEAYAKNVGILAARYPFICVTNCDIVFGSCFFEFAPSLTPGVFYRFLQYETDAVHSSVDAVLAAPATCINPTLADPTQWTLNTIAYKSGDIMLMDSDSWRRIRGYPENDVWVHSDLIVCTVARNAGLKLMVPPSVRIYTSPQDRAHTTRGFELAKAYEYLDRLTCN